MRLGARGVGGRAENSLPLSWRRGSRERRFRIDARRWGGAPLLARSSLGVVSATRGGVMSELLLDAAGRRRSPATMPEFHAGRPPRNKGIRYPADPPTVEEIVAVMGATGDTMHGFRLRGLIVVLWRAGLRIHEALALTEADLDARRGSVLVRPGGGGRRPEAPALPEPARAARRGSVLGRRGGGGRRREVGMDGWACEQLQQWLDVRV